MCIFLFLILSFRKRIVWNLLCISFGTVPQSSTVPLNWSSCVKANERGWGRESSQLTQNKVSMLKHGNLASLLSAHLNQCLTLFLWVLCFCQLKNHHILLYFGCWKWNRILYQQEKSSREGSPQKYQITFAFTCSLSKLSWMPNGIG